MSEINSCGPAYPCISMADGGPVFYDGNRQMSHNGMSLRDWFAGMAMCGMYSEDAEAYSFEKVAAAAYETADAMIAQRKKEVNK